MWVLSWIVSNLLTSFLHKDSPKLDTASQVMPNLCQAEVDNHLYPLAMFLPMKVMVQLTLLCMCTHCWYASYSQGCSAFSWVSVCTDTRSYSSSSQRFQARFLSDQPSSSSLLLTWSFSGQDHPLSLNALSKFAEFYIIIQLANENIELYQPQYEPSRSYRGFALKFDMLRFLKFEIWNKVNTLVW